MTWLSSCSCLDAPQELPSAPQRSLHRSSSRTDQAGCIAGGIGSRFSIALLSLISESCSNVTTGLPWASKSMIRLSPMASELLLSRSARAIERVSVSGN